MRVVIGRVDELPPGSRTRVTVDGRAVVVFSVDGAYFALRDTCPHRGARLSDGTVVDAVSAPEAGRYTSEAGRYMVKCPWHGWEYDLDTGRSWCDPENDRVRPYDVSVQPGSCLADDDTPAAGYTAETLPIRIDGDYVVIER